MPNEVASVAILLTYYFLPAPLSTESSSSPLCPLHVLLITMYLLLLLLDEIMLRKRSNRMCILILIGIVFNLTNQHHYHSYKPVGAAPRSPLAHCLADGHRHRRPMLQGLAPGGGRSSPPSASCMRSWPGDGLSAVMLSRGISPPY